MDDQSIYSEKKLAYYETNYKENLLAKPQEVNLSVTAAHLFGLAFICEQIGTMEDDPTYTRFSCSFDEITKIYINNSNRNSPIYIQCDQNTKGVINRRRIILPCFPNNDQIVNIINNAKAEYDKKLEKQRENEKSRKMQEYEERKNKENEELKKKNDELKKVTSDFTNSVADAARTAQIDELITFDIEPVEETPVVPDKEAFAEPEIFDEPVEVESEPVYEFGEVKPEPAPAPAEVKPIPAVAPAPVEIKPSPAIAPAPADIRPARAAVQEVNPAESKPMASTIRANPAPAPAPIPVQKPAPVVEKVEPEVKTAKVEDKAEPEVKPVIKDTEKPAKRPGRPKADKPKNDDMSLEDFEVAVKKLKVMLDNGVLSNDEFAEEKKKLLKLLY